MDIDTLTCLCGRYFDRPAALSNHQRTCKRTKSQITNLLAKAKTIWAKKQKRNIQAEEMQANAQAGLETSMQSPLENDSSVVESTPPQAPNEMVPQDSTAPGIHHNEEDLSSDLSIAARRTRRKIRLPGHFDDMIPHSCLDKILDRMAENDAASDEAASTASEAEAEADSNNSPSIQPMLCLPRDKFGVFRSYYSASHVKIDPDRHLTLRDLSDNITETENNSSELCGVDIRDLSKDKNTIILSEEYGPYPNKSSFLLAEWYWSSKQKSRRDFQALLQILTHDNFNPRDIQKTPWFSIDRLLGSSITDYSKLGLDPDAGWSKEEIQILVPFHRLQSDTGPAMYTVGTFFRRSIISVIKEALAGLDGEHFHFDPFELYWQPDTEASKSREPMRIYGEIYNSTAFAEEYKQLQSLPSEPGCSLPRSIVALMFSSDETHLTQYGSSTIWPLYMFFGNVSKYIRKQSSSRQYHHIAYFTALPDDFNDFVRAQTEKAPTDSLVTFCGHESYHTQWKQILDEEFIEAYAHGIIIQCLDGITRRLYPRIFTLSADYKEKAILAGIRQLGTHPCPRCLITLKNVPQMGTDEDRKSRLELKRQDDDNYRDILKDARKQIFEDRYAVKGAVDAKLDPLSLTPNENAFSTRLSQYGFDVFKASVVDLLHDTEQGSWRAVFVHLIRILHCEDKIQVLKLDERFREVPSFGRDTIRKFRQNLSEMKGLAARDFEDMLQCSIPVFEGLLPEPYNGCVIRLLYIFAQWHGLAKLRIHTEATLQLLDQTTTELGDIMREFQKETCQAYETKEFEKEKERRLKAEEKAKQKQAREKTANSKAIEQDASEPAIVTEDLAENSSIAASNSKSLNSQGKQDITSKLKEFSLRTYKFHALGDYVEAIKFYGTTDSYSTETGESEHRRLKSRYARTNKKDFIQQMTETERREARLNQIRKENLMNFNEEDVSQIKQDLLIGQSTRERYHISRSQSKTEHILDLLRTYNSDPAMKNFLSDLKAHLLPRACKIFGLDQESWSPHSEHQSSISIFFQNDRIYQHKVLRINYTTYDLRRAQDFINPSTTQSNIMLLADENNLDSDQALTTPSSPQDNSHPFIYAKVLKIFHVNVICTAENTSPNSVRMDILWVQWYQHHSTQSSHKLDQLSFPSMHEDHAFGFIDPRDVIRAAHIIPVFAQGYKHESQYQGLSAFAGDKNDWKMYYVNRFVDRDMLMRYHFGLGIGHIASLRQSYSPTLQTTVIATEASEIHQQSDESMANSGSKEALSSNEWANIERMYYGAEIEEEVK